MTNRTHTKSGWTRTSLADGSMRWRITPTDNTGARIVSFMSAGSWANYPQDDRAQINSNRVILLEGAPLPDWAHAWLTAANNKSCGRAREAFQSAIDRADFDAGMRDANYY